MNEDDRKIGSARGPRQRGARQPDARRRGLGVPGRAVLMGASVLATAGIAAGLWAQDDQRGSGPSGATVEQSQDLSPSFPTTPPTIGGAPDVVPSQEEPNAESAAS
jgi:hypothetical protein